MNMLSKMRTLDVLESIKRVVEDDFRTRDEIKISGLLVTHEGASCSITIGDDIYDLTLKNTSKQKTHTIPMTFDEMPENDI